MRLASFLVVATLATSATFAAADAPKGGTVVAEALFREGRRLMKEGKFADACPKLEESQRIDPKLGTLLNLAACHAAIGRTATAWAEYNEAASQATHAGRAEYVEIARKQIAELGAGSLGSALPVDPGKHAIVAKAPGHKTWSQEVDVAKGPSTATVSIPQLEVEAVVEPKPIVADRPLRREEPPQPSYALTWTLGAVTVVSAGVGTYFGLRAVSKNSQAEEKCPGGLCRDDGLDLDHQARTSATISTIAFGVTVAAAVGTIWSYASTKSSVSVGVAPGGLALTGVF
jgi:hypothetical protein